MKALLEVLGFIAAGFVLCLLLGWAIMFLAAFDPILGFIAIALVAAVAMWAYDDHQAEMERARRGIREDD